MKRKYSMPQTLRIPVKIESSLLVGSANNYADSKKTYYEENILSDQVADEDIPHYNIWDE